MLHTNGRIERPVLKLLEVNPRIGGGTIFATLACVNFPVLVLGMVKEKEIVKPAFSEIITVIVRYFEEILMDRIDG